MRFNIFPCFENIGDPPGIKELKDIGRVLVFDVLNLGRKY
jgi:hypothetical protein